MAVFAVTVGDATTVATCTAAPLEPPFDVTTAVKLPVDVGGVVNGIVKLVVEAAIVGVPTAPKLKATEFVVVVEKFVPVMVTDATFCARFAVFAVTVGGATTAATCTAAPLVPPFDVTTAVKLPVALGFDANVIVKLVADEAMAGVPTAPKEVKATEFVVVVEKFVPVIVTVFALSARLVVVAVTVGDATTVATCMAPLLPFPATVTFAVKLPSEVGVVVNVTTNCVIVDPTFTVPTAPRLKTTVLLVLVVEKFVPVIVTVVALCA